ncbi:Stp1/IreP family PP2C-type Ser/Thr phosphatase [Ktedonospora formicarum]|uniref:PPM-type phosphatase domain-containing protein n=1 Tax=Ktedonospora formicarum TaxID=2778364 RepID=A0A8J3HW63_9CHLR|nr:Stp1/IreP family PP2C-type Ser/Thr phosphatase [Ktedonospora formicarum]GHO43126.1 hypothetical protein KSX_12890 [Ktedonospora formicarum]
MSKQLRLDVAQLTDVGRRRPHNEDNMAYVIPKDAQMMAKKGALFIVADGMGGHAAGEVASEIAVDTISKEYYQNGREDVTESLVYSIKRANTLIHQRAAESVMRSGMGTTCVAAVLCGGTAYVANVGDSRAYLMHKGQVKQVSQDHSWVEEQVRAGLLTGDQARSHAQRNVITRSLGTNAEVEIDIFSEPLEEGDSLLLCSDGLSGQVEDDELRSIVDQYQPRESVYHLVERANENGGPDNITAIVIRVQEVGWEPPNARRPMRMSSREVSDEPTKIIGSLAGAPVGLLTQSADASYPNSPLRVASGSLAAEGMPAPQAAVPLPPSKSKRLLFPTLAIFVLLIVALLGGGAFYFLGLGQMGVNVNESLSLADQYITQAKGTLTSDPANALRELKNAQQQMTRVQHVALSTEQRTKLNSLSGTLVTSTKSAITNYNQRYLISPIPCSNTGSASISSGKTKAQADTLAVVQHNDKKLFYALGYDKAIYLMSQNGGTHTLGEKINVEGQVLSIASAGTRLLVLTLNLNDSSYSLQVLTPSNDAGTAFNTTKLPISQELTAEHTPAPLISAWDNDAFVVLNPTNSDSTVLVLKYDLNATDAKAQKMELSAGKILSLAAFPDKQLFLLLDNGNIQSVLFAEGKRAAAGVGIQQPIYTPLSVSTQGFTSSTSPVPAPVPQMQTLLMIPRATTSVLAANKVGDVPHLFIADSSNHRLLDLNIVSSGNSGTTLSGDNTTGTPQLKMQLSRQYVSPVLLNSLKSITPDPDGNKVILISQSGPVDAPRTQIDIDANKSPNTCQP